MRRRSPPSLHAIFLKLCLLSWAKIFIHQGWERPRCEPCSIFCSMAILGVLPPPSPKNLGIPRKMYEKERDIIPFKEKFGKKGIRRRENFLGLSTRYFGLFSWGCWGVLPLLGRGWGVLPKLPRNEKRNKVSTVVVITLLRKNKRVQLGNLANFETVPVCILVRLG